MKHYFGKEEYVVHVLGHRCRLGWAGLSSVGKATWSLPQGQGAKRLFLGRL